MSAGVLYINGNAKDILKKRKKVVSIIAIKNESNVVKNIIDI